MYMMSAKAQKQVLLSLAKDVAAGLAQQQQTDAVVTGLAQHAGDVSRLEAERDGLAALIEADAERSRRAANMNNKRCYL